MAVMFVVPVAPYAHATPNRKNAEENAPSRKYFMAASLDVRRPVIPVKTYRDSDRISRDRNTRMRSAAAVINVIPAVANRTSG